MKKLIVILMILTLLIGVPAFAQVDIEGPSTSGPLSPIGGANAQAGATSNSSANAFIGNGFGNFSPSASSASAVIGSGNSFTVNDNDNSNRNYNSDTNVNIVAPKQRNSQKNNQSTTVTFKSPTQLLSAPSQGVPELNFGNGRMSDCTKDLPNFAIYGIKKLGSEMITKVILVNANVKFKNLYQEILDDAKDIAGTGGESPANIRFQVIRAESNKSWSTGGNLGGAGSFLPTSGLAGASAAGSLIPSWGSTKADDLFTIIFVRVAL